MEPSLLVRRFSRMNMTLHYMGVYVFWKGDKCPICGTTRGDEILHGPVESGVFKGPPPSESALNCQTLVFHNHIRALSQRPGRVFSEVTTYGCG